MSAHRAIDTTRKPVRLGDAHARKRSRAREHARSHIAAFLRKLAYLVGIRKSIVVQGVRYHERDQTPIRRALAPRGPGHKEYSVRFADNARMRIRCTADRIYSDLMHDPRLEVYELAVSRVRPGQRVLEINCGTGAGSQRLARAVGTSGAVVAIDRDRESIRFARRRYAAPNLAFEIGTSESLHGELDGAFDACFVCTRSAVDFSEIWRCLAPGGTMLLWPDPALLPDLPGIDRSLRIADVTIANSARLITREEAPAHPRHKTRTEDSDHDG
ncbi:MAG: methyltransferase domain-containing protein [Phycisphaeraceae bacterium]|nr:methyltransferase domain-containing protein [Phycisphaeraceae bacterium]MCW5763404.1 methyltransferase domain-containing protein [Phycisphaeraceae bacterium]